MAKSVNAEQQLTELLKLLQLAHQGGETREVSLGGIEVKVSRRKFSKERATEIGEAWKEDLRGRIRICGEKPATIAQKTGIPHPSLSRFINSNGSLKFETAAILFEYLGLELTHKSGMKWTTSRRKNKSEER